MILREPWSMGGPPRDLLIELARVVRDCCEEVAQEYLVTKRRGITRWSAGAIRLEVIIQAVRALPTLLDYERSDGEGCCGLKFVFVYGEWTFRIKRWDPNDPKLAAQLYGRSKGNANTDQLSLPLAVIPPADQTWWLVYEVDREGRLGQASLCQFDAFGTAVCRWPIPREAEAAPVAGQPVLRAEAAPIEKTLITPRYAGEQANADE
ncbi:MAG: hypothetical protein AB1505_30825 [Candidatus Latescibacterota bacterium]